MNDSRVLIRAFFRLHGFEIPPDSLSHLPPEGRRSALAEALKDAAPGHLNSVGFGSCRLRDLPMPVLVLCNDVPEVVLIRRASSRMVAFAASDSGSVRRMRLSAFESRHRPEFIVACNGAVGESGGPSWGRCFRNFVDANRSSPHFSPRGY